MKQIKDYGIDFKTDNLIDQVNEFFDYYHEEKTRKHSFEVAEEAKKLAEIFGVSKDKAFVASLLHDISVVIPNEDRISVHEGLNLNVLPEERLLPMILHQKQSVLIAKEIFGINDKEVLSAIESHTTLRKNASDLDKVVFIADKIKWDRDDCAPYLASLIKALQKSLNDGCRCYLDWAMIDIYVVHPWLKEARVELGMNE